jgi:hypothetical protein
LADEGREPVESPETLPEGMPNRLAFAPATGTGGIHDACSASPNGSGSPMRGRGRANRRSVFSGPSPGRQIVGVAVAILILGLALVVVDMILLPTRSDVVVGDCRLLPRVKMERVSEVL